MVQQVVVAFVLGAFIVVAWTASWETQRVFDRGTPEIHRECSKQTAWRPIGAWRWCVVKEVQRQGIDKPAS